MGWLVVLRGQGAGAGLRLRALSVLSWWWCLRGWKYVLKLRMFYVKGLACSAAAMLRLRGPLRLHGNSQVVVLVQGDRARAA